VTTTETPRQTADGAAPAVEEMLVCRLCGCLKPENQFYRDRVGRKAGTRRECKTCHSDRYNAEKVRSKARVRVRRALLDAPYRALARMCRDDPDLLALVARQNPLKFKRYVWEEQRRIFEEYRDRALALGDRKSNRHDTRQMWRELEGEFEASRRLMGPVPRRKEGNQVGEEPAC
jgi:hypothetical protein